MILITQKNRVISGTLFSIRRAVVRVVMRGRVPAQPCALLTAHRGQDEDDAASGPLPQHDVAATGPGDPPGEGQAEARAAAVGVAGDAGLEAALAEPGVDAGTVVADGSAQPGAGARRDLDGHARARVASRVVD